MQHDPVKLVTLLTLNDLEEFWAKHKSDLPYGAHFRGCRYVSAPFNWVFGASKLAVVDVALQWQYWQASCTWRNADKEELANADSDCNLGFWEFTSLPFNLSAHEWFVEPFDLTDPNHSSEEIMQMFKIRTFDTWRQGSGSPVVFMCSDEMDDEIDYWQQERAAGEDHYGSMNE